MNIVFRVDASREIGTGHLSRCRVLADKLREQGAESLFLCRYIDESSAAALQDAGFRLARLRNATAESGGDLAHSHWLRVAQQQDAEDSLDAMRDAGMSAPDWIVVDHYALDARWEQQVRDSGARILAIDDLADREHDADIVLDQNLRADAGDAYRRLAPAARLLMGPRYALLRGEFAQEPARNRSQPAVRVFVSFGGSDSGNATGKVLEALSRPPLNALHADIVIGSMHPYRDELQAAVSRRGNALLHVNSHDVAALMRRADIAIGAGGVMTWERCACALPAIAFPIAENQRTVLSAAADAGTLLMPDEDCLEKPDKLAAQVLALSGNMLLRRQLAEQARRLCDGHGADRVAAAIRAAGLRLRSAGEDDKWRILEWRNHPGVRASSFDEAPIERERHARWFERVLNDPDRMLLIGELSGEPVGVIRYDIEGSEAEVSIFLDPQLTGSGIGAAMLAAGEDWLRGRRADVARIRAQVRAGNAASERLFRNAGFKAAQSVWYRQLA